MRRVKFLVVGLGAIVGLITSAVVMFRRNPRIGSRFVNSVVNPALIEHGLAGAGRAEIGTIEQFGRHSGKRYLTPVYPMPTPDGFRMIVPLGSHSEWARNVLSAGHCRLQLHDVVYDLDEPRMMQPTDVEGVPRVLGLIADFLGFQFVALRRFSEAPGTLEVAGIAEEPAGPEATPELVDAAS